MSFSQNIKRLRLEKGMTQEQLASLLGVSAQAVSKWETSETYPDGTLLVPIADALNVSLDTLFDNNVNSMNDLSARIMRLIYDTPEDKHFFLVRDICWQIEKGLFKKDFGYEINCGYSPDEINNRKTSSYILNDYGFTHVSNGSAPFFSVFPEYGDSLSEVIGDGEETRKVFEALASPETIRAILFLYKKERDYVFEAELLSELCGIPSERLDGVMNNLTALHTVSKVEIDIDGKPCTLYSSKPKHTLIPLFLFAHELNYCGGYCFQKDNRSKPYLK